MGCSGPSKVVESKQNDLKGGKSNSNDNNQQSNKEKVTSGQAIITNKSMLNRDTVGKHYKLLGKIGAGAFGKVYKAMHLSTNQVRAVKVVKKSMLKYQDGDRTFLKEIELLVSLDHPNIIKVYEYFEDQENYYVVEELANGGELYEQLQKLQTFSEVEAAKIMKQIISAIIYLHDNNICHRDLKPENILLESSENNNDCIVKIVDFGTANYCTQENGNLTLKVGTPYYIAPEVIKKNYDKQCDVWSAGVILYILLAGYPPYDGEDDEDIMRNIINKDYDFLGDEWKDISKSAMDLIAKMLIKEPSKRIKAKDIVNDIWFVTNLKDNETLKSNNIKEHFKNIMNFSKKEKLQQACIAFLVHNMSTNEQVKELRSLFLSLDKSGDGRLTIDEIRQGMKKLYSSNNEVETSDLEEVLKHMDIDSSGFIEYEEFIVATINKNFLLTESNLKQAFDYFDKNGSGHLDQKEVKALMVMLYKKDVCQKEIQKIIYDLDTNKDGEISFDEFKVLMRKVLV